MSPWSSSKALTYLIEDAYILIRDWLDESYSLSLGGGYSIEFPARFVDECISKYLVTITGDSKQLSSNLHHTQARVRQLF